MKTTLLLVMCMLCHTLYSQSAQAVEGINKSIDQAVITKDMTLLRNAYATDFVFTHGTGHVDTRDSWLKNVEDVKTRFLSRDHDSVQVEAHNDIAIVTGKLSIARQGTSEVTRYAIRYVRVYAWREKHWQLISHRTVKQWNL